MAAFAIALVMTCSPVESNAVTNVADKEPETVILETVTPAVGEPVERHTGYYYPTINSPKRYERRARTLLGKDVESRTGSVTAITYQ